MKLLFRLFLFIIQLFVIFADEYNVLLVIADDLRPALGCYQDRYAYTPNIDALAKKGLVFNNAFVQQSLCAPSRNSFLTSRRPDTLRLYDFYSYWRNVAGNFTTLPQHFKEHGYHTMSIGKVFHPGISSNNSDDQPYSWSEPPFHAITEQYRNAAVCRDKGRLGRNLVCPVEVTIQPGGTLPDIEIVKTAKKFLLNRRDKIQPFFLAVGFHKPHVPLKYPKEYLALHPLESMNLPKNHWRPSSLPTVAWNPWTDVRSRDDISNLNVSFPFGPLPDHTSRLIRQSYYAAVSYIDDLFGQLIKTLKKVNHFNDTIIVITGDHGWSLAEHGEWAKYSNFEVALKVPLIVYVPGLTDARHFPKSSDALVELVDVFPTLVELTNISSVLPLCPLDSSHMQLCSEGISFAPLVQQASKKSRMPVEWKTGVFSQYPRPGAFPTLRPNSDKPHLRDIHIMGYSLRTARHRYTEWLEFDLHRLAVNWSCVMARELYDHHLDPNENLNLANREVLHSVMSRLSRQLRLGWRHSLPMSHACNYEKV